LCLNWYFLAVLTAGSLRAFTAEVWVVIGVLRDQLHIDAKFFGVSGDVGADCGEWRLVLGCDTVLGRSGRYRPM